MTWCGLVYCLKRPSVECYVSNKSAYCQHKKRVWLLFISCLVSQGTSQQELQLAVKLLKHFVGMLETCSFTKKSNSQIFGSFSTRFFPTTFSLICSQNTEDKQTMGAKRTIRISFKIIRTKIKSYSVTQNNIVIEFTGA